MHSTDRLYRFYAEHYHRLEQDFSQVRPWYGAADLAMAGVTKLSQEEFVEQVRSMATTPDLLLNWLLRILRDQDYDEDEIEQELNSILPKASCVNSPHFRLAARTLNRCSFASRKQT